jgi:hypothetical protein
MDWHGAPSIPLAHWPFTQMLDAQSAMFAHGAPSIPLVHIPFTQ